MLKIKDNVDLKELKKFGFVRKLKKRIELKVWTYEFRINNSFISVSEKNKYCSFRELRLFVDDIVVLNRVMISKIYDLIQAGLVEKVEGK